MEGKAVLFDALVGINGVPILIQSKDNEEIIRTVPPSRPPSGPSSSRTSRRRVLRDRRPAERDAGHPRDARRPARHRGVVLAALLNASKYVGMQVKNDTVGMVGSGPGIGISKLLMAYGVRKMQGTDINPVAQEIFAKAAEADDAPGDHGHRRHRDLHDRRPGLIRKEMIRKGQVILALSNPRPEIFPRRRGPRGLLRRRRPRGEQRAGVPGGLPRGR